MNKKLKNINPDTKSTKSTRRKIIFSRLSTFISLVVFIISSSIVSVSAAPEGVNTSQFTKIVNIVFWIIEGCLAIYGGVGLFHIVKGQNDEDSRTRNGGIVGLGVAALGIGATAAVKAIFFS